MLELFSSIFRKWFNPRQRQDAMGSDTEVATSSAVPLRPEIGVPHGSALVPYEEDLLERARTQWEFGDWASLVAIERDALQHHPDRAKLALLAAAGHMQSADPLNARQFVRLAQDWGCNQKLIAQILAAGVHNSLGRAATVAGQHDRAAKHFTSAITTGSPGAEARLLGKARAAEQLMQLGRSVSTLPVAAGTASSISGGTVARTSYVDDVKHLTEAITQQKYEIESQMKKQADDLKRYRSAIDSTIKKELSNATKQIEAFIGMQSYFSSGDLPTVNPERHTWPISPDFGLYLIELLETRDYNLVIEFGSGISTVVVAKAIAKLARRAPSASSIEFVSFDHLERFYKETLGRIQQANVEQYARVVHAPLKEIELNGRVAAFYDCRETLAELAQRHLAKSSRVLVIVDGPPAATGKNARYPAGPLVLAHFSVATIDLLLDDYMRDDEKEIARMWEAEITASGLQFTTTESKLEKDACLITIEPKHKEFK